MSRNLRRQEVREAAPAVVVVLPEVEEAVGSVLEEGEVAEELPEVEEVVDSVADSLLEAVPEEVVVVASEAVSAAAVKPRFGWRLGATGWEFLFIWVPILGPNKIFRPGSIRRIFLKMLYNRLYLFFTGNI